MKPTPNKVFVSGCYDMLHSGHVAFFEEAAQWGDLYVGLGSDQTVYNLKARRTINHNEERLYMVQAIRFVKKAWINKGSGILDFNEDLKNWKPNIFFVNEDGHSPQKEAFCKKKGIEYKVSKRIPHSNLPKRSTTALRQECQIPYRIDLAGGWLDQPFVSKFAAGSVITISIKPDYDFNDRSGMSTSTRKKAIELWESQIPAGDPEKLAKTLFCFENEPGNPYISGSQDSLGIVMQGMNQLYYDQREYWPSQIKTQKNEEIITWLENHIRLMSLSPRANQLNVLDGKKINKEQAEKLSVAAKQLWEAAQERNSLSFGTAMTASFQAQTTMFPNMLNKEIIQQIEKIKKQCLGYKLSGAGGGGYLVLFTEEEIPNTLKIRIRR